jgi:CheY-like chemotaxis protein
MRESALHWLSISDNFMRPPFGSAADRESSPEAERSRARILVVDDQKLIVDTIAEILEGAGFEVAVACDAWTALELELAIAVRKMYPSVKILLFTGQAGISEILEGAEEQGYKFEVIPKPIHPQKLIERIKKQE